MDNKQIKEQILQVMEANSSFLITTHIKPDGDGLGSSYALYHFLKSRGKRVVIVLDAPLPESFATLDDAEFTTVDQVTSREIDVIFILDTCNYRRIGKVGAFIRNHRAQKVTIDHHVAHGVVEGDIQLLDDSACAVGQLIYQILSLSGAVPLASAYGIYLSIVTDTGNFQYSNATAESHRIAAELIALGVKPNIFHKSLYQSRQESTLRLLGLVLTTLKVYEGRLAVLTVSLEDLRATHALPETVDGFVNYALSLKGVEVGLLLEEKEEGLTRISMRSKDYIDVSKVAQQYSGGGHKRAAGAHLSCSLPTATNLVVNYILEALQQAGPQAGAPSYKVKSICD